MVIVYRSCVGWYLRRYQIAAEFTYTPEDTHSKYQTRSQSGSYFVFSVWDLQAFLCNLVICVSSGYLAIVSAT